jgi:hypothetical protein
MDCVRYAGQFQALTPELAEHLGMQAVGEEDIEEIEERNKLKRLGKFGGA